MTTLPPLPQIMNALKTFGMGEEDKEVLAVVLGKEEEVEDKVTKITQQVSGKVSLFGV